MAANSDMDGSAARIIQTSLQLLLISQFNEIEVVHSLSK